MNINVGNLAIMWAGASPAPTMNAMPNENNARIQIISQMRIIIAIAQMRKMWAGAMNVNVGNLATMWAGASPARTMNAMPKCENNNKFELEIG